MNLNMSCLSHGELYYPSPIPGKVDIRVADHPDETILSLFPPVMNLFSWGILVVVAYVVRGLYRWFENGESVMVSGCSVV